ncbi:MAG: hypothetical protein LT080_13520 [Thiobacillus sp.]|nr:hypothetical protein [Thiobacillus sp.]
MKDVHPFLVLSPRIFNTRTSLVINPHRTPPPPHPDSAWRNAR